MRNYAHRNHTNEVHAPFWDFLNLFSQKNLWIVDRERSGHFVHVPDREEFSAGLIEEQDYQVLPSET
jgi:hypothetical protein